MLIEEYRVLNVTNMDIIVGELKVAIKAGMEVDLMQLPGITLGQIEKAELYGSLGIRLRQRKLIRTSIDYGIKAITVGSTEYVGEFNFAAGTGVTLSEDADGTTISATGGGGGVSGLVIDGITYTGNVGLDSGDGIDFDFGPGGVTINSFIPDGYAVTELVVDGTPYAGSVTIDSGDGIDFNLGAGGFEVSSFIPDGYAVTELVVDGTPYAGSVTIDSGDSIGFDLSTGGFTVNSSFNIVDVDVSSYSVELDDDFISVSYTSEGPVEVILPSTAPNGKSYIVKDSAGNALTNNITVKSTNGFKIDDEDEYIITGDFDSISAVCDGYGYLVY